MGGGTGGMPMRLEGQKKEEKRICSPGREMAAREEV